MTGHVRDAFVKFLSQIADFLRVRGQVFLPPSIGDRPQQSDQRHRSGQDHPLFHALLEERRVLFQGGAVEIITGQKQHHEFGRGLELFPIRLFA